MRVCSNRLIKHLWVWVSILVLASCATHSSKHGDSQTDSTPPRAYFPVDSTLRSPLGVRTAFRLRDSSPVILNSATKLQYAQGFPVKNRLLALDGDAFFTLYPGEHPAVIHTGMLTLSGQKAQFRIYAHAESRGQSVEVLSGKLQAVKAYPSDYPDTEQLRAGDMVMINRDIDLMEKETFDTLTLRAWLDGTLSFRDASFGEIVRKLEDWYDLEIHVSGNTRPENQDTLTAEFRHQPLSAVLDQLARQAGFTYQISANQVSINLK